MSDPRAAITAATKRYRRTEQAHEESRQAVIGAVLAALRAGVGPTEAADLSPFSTAYVRRLAREADIPPAPPGPKTGAKAPVRPAVRRAGE